MQNRLIQIGQTGGQEYSGTSPFSILWKKEGIEFVCVCVCVCERERESKDKDSEVERERTKKVEKGQKERARQSGKKIQTRRKK